MDGQRDGDPGTEDNEHSPAPRPPPTPAPGGRAAPAEGRGGDGGPAGSAPSPGLGGAQPPLAAPPPRQPELGRSRREPGGARSAQRSPPGMREAVSERPRRGCRGRGGGGGCRPPEVARPQPMGEGLGRGASPSELAPALRHHREGLNFIPYSPSLGTPCGHSAGKVGLVAPVPACGNRRPRARIAPEPRAGLGSELCARRSLPIPGSRRWEGENPQTALEALEVGRDAQGPAPVPGTCSNARSGFGDLLRCQEPAPALGTHCSARSSAQGPTPKGRDPLWFWGPAVVPKTRSGAQGPAPVPATPKGRRGNGPCPAPGVAGDPPRPPGGDTRVAPVAFL
ncbi:skin secretory protein xP2-like [Ammospiza caudacuta]|uniref:skin secretory protein xP2-like n=1 Tax=Ammospiza caudacuta TaxID=2857398 RepID=UPI002738CB03|nr:skin secretory protein xP2-like [Ammospiza caudacuta]